MGMAIMYHRSHHEMGEDLRDQIMSLNHEVAALRKHLARGSRGALKHSRHMGEEAADWLREYAESALPEIRRGAHQLHQSAREHPGTTAGVAAAAVIVLGLAATFLMRR